MRYALLGAAAVIAVIVAVLAIGRETQPGPDDAATAVPAPTANGSGERAPPSTEVTDHTPTRVPVVAEPAKRPPPKRAARTAPRADKVETSTAPGLLSVGAEPTARLYLDGRYIEETPTYRHKVAAGRHELRLVPATGKAYQRTIQIEAGKELNLGTVRW
jgi:hypothetical protein